MVSDSMTRRQFAKTLLAVGTAGCSFRSAAADSAVPLKLNESPDGFQKKIDKKIKKWLKRYDVPGLSVSLIQDQRPQWHQSYGLKNVDQKSVVDEETVFEAASLTKPIAAFVALTLAQEGKLDLDNPLAHYMNARDQEGFPRQYLRITARNTLSHTSGLPNWRVGEKLPDLAFDPGVRFSYSGEGFVMLQSVMKRITGKPLDVLCREIVFEPLNMNRSSLIWKEEFDATLALGYGKKITKGMKRKMPDPIAASSLITSPREYSLFVSHVLDSLKKRTNARNEAVCRSMVTPEVDVRSGISWGLGWGLQNCGGEKAFWHWGNNGNRYHSFVIGYPEHGLGLVIMSNSGNGLPLCRELVPELIGGCHPALDWRMVVG